MNLGEGSAASHIDLWAVGVRIVLDYPVLGVGPENYPDLFVVYEATVLPPERAAVMARFRPEGPHDVPLAVAVGAGIPALAAYLAVIAGALLAGLRRLRGASHVGRLLLAGMLAGAVGHVVTDLFMTADVSGSWVFWVLLGVFVAPRVADGRTADPPFGSPVVAGKRPPLS